MRVTGAILAKPASRRCGDCGHIFTTNDLNVVSCYRCRTVTPASAPAQRRRDRAGADRDDILFLLQQVASLTQALAETSSRLAKLERRSDAQAESFSAIRARLRKHDADLPLAAPVVGRTLEAVRAAVCAAFDVTELQICARRQTRALACPRHAFYLLARETTVHSHESIAKAVGRNDPTTALSGIKRARLLAAQDPAFAAALAKAREALNHAQ